MPITLQWLAFLLVLLIAYLAAKNAVLREHQREQKKQLDLGAEVSQRERSSYQQTIDLQQQLLTVYQAQLAEQTSRIQELTNRLDRLKYLCDN